MDARATGPRKVDVLAARPDLRAPPLELPTLTLAELNGIVHSGRNESDLLERGLAQAVRTAAALDLTIGDCLAELQPKGKLIQLGFARLGDYAENVLGMNGRTAQAAAQLSRELKKRPLLRAATWAGEVTPCKALKILPVAVGEAEAEWVERAKKETVGSLERAVKQARRERSKLPGPDAAVEAEEAAAEPPLAFSAWLTPTERGEVEEALALAATGPAAGASRARQLEALAQEWLGEHPLEGETRIAPCFRELAPSGAVREEREAKLERESEGWTWLEQPKPVPAQEIESHHSVEEIDATVRGYLNERMTWDDTIGALCDAVKRTGLHRLSGFADFDHHAKERLGLAPRTIEQRAALERRMREMPALRRARDAGLKYEKLRLLSTLRNPVDVVVLAEAARKLTVVELREKVTALRDGTCARHRGQMRAPAPFRALVPREVAEVLSESFQSVRKVEGMELSAGSCLVRLARHFKKVWKEAEKPPKTRAQKVRARDVRCKVPGCSYPADESHHVDFRSHGGSDDMENQAGGCFTHHHLGIHGGYITVTGTAPDALVWTVGGRVWKDAEFGRDEQGNLLPLEPDECAKKKAS